mgnify:FL=1
MGRLCLLWRRNPMISDVPDEKWRISAYPSMHLWQPNTLPEIPKH